MSGPKSYSVQVFDKFLKEIFLLQSELKLLWDDLKEKKVNSERHHFNFDTSEFIKNNSSDFSQHTDPYIFLGADSVSQQAFDDYYNQVYKTIEKLLHFKNRVKNEMGRIDTIEAGYQDYLEVEGYAGEVKDSFHAIKIQSIKYLHKNLKDHDNLQKLAEEVEGIKLELSLPEFSATFNHETAVKLKKEYDLALNQNRQLLNKIMHQVLQATKQPQKQSKPEKPETENQVIPNDLVSEQEFSLYQLKIDKLLPRVSDQVTAATFKKRFAQFLTEKDTTETYFLVELLEDIKDEIIRQKFMQQLDELSVKIDSQKFEGSIQEKARLLKRKIRKACKHDNLKKVDIDKFTGDYQLLKTDNDRLLHLKSMHEAETKYIKTMIVKGFQDLDYEVMDDMQVVDFEKSDSFLLDIPGQDNYLNLRFDNDQLLYNFLIPENRENLSHEQAQKRIAEMEETCTQFKQMLEKLKAGGLNINLQKELEATEKALIQVPPNLRKLTGKSSNQRKVKNGQSQKRYLKK
nr:hypothetical protein [Bacteroidota bacterium]